MEPPINWLLAAAVVFSRGAQASEYFGHAIRLAAQEQKPTTLLRIAERAKRVHPIMARLARRAAAGHDVTDGIAFHMRSLDADPAHACVPSIDDLSALPPTLETISTLPREHIYYPHSAVPQRLNGELRSDMRWALRRQAVSSLIGEGAHLLQHYHHAAWAWRFFEAAEQLRDEQAADSRIVVVRMQHEAGSA